MKFDEPTFNAAVDRIEFGPALPEDFDRTFIRALHSSVTIVTHGAPDPIGILRAGIHAALSCLSNGDPAQAEAHLLRAKRATDFVAEAIANAPDRATPTTRITAYLRSRAEQPLLSLGDAIHCVHTGSEYEAELRLSDVRAMMAELERLRGVVAAAARSDGLAGRGA